MHPPIRRTVPVAIANPEPGAAILPAIELREIADGRLPQGEWKAQPSITHFDPDNHPPMR